MLSKKESEKGEVKVKDHDHITWKIKGPHIKNII